MPNSPANLLHVKRHALNGVPGLVSRAKSRLTGSTISVWQGEDGKPWMVMCESHREAMEQGSLSAARRSAADPGCWCSECEKVRNG